MKSQSKNKKKRRMSLWNYSWQHNEFSWGTNFLSIKGISKVVSCSISLMLTLTWITVIKTRNRGDEFEKH